jgi:hypothetical protein
MFLRWGLAWRIIVSLRGERATVALGFFFGAPGLDNGGGRLILLYN